MRAAGDLAAVVTTICVGVVSATVEHVNVITAFATLFAAIGSAIWCCMRAYHTYLHIRSDHSANVLGSNPNEPTKEKAYEQAGLQDE
jgi:hypothetical protein